MATLHSITASQRVREERRTVSRALKVLKGKMRKPGEAFQGVSAARDFLTLNLAGYDREVFSALWLDAQHRLIEAEHLAIGTLTQTSVYPREVIKRALHHNAAAVIFAHNHPSGTTEPSQSDRILTDALKHALALLDVRVLDHFIVAGMEVVSMEECRSLRTSERPPRELQTERADDDATKESHKHAKAQQENTKTGLDMTTGILFDILTVKAQMRAAFALLEDANGYGDSDDLCDVGFSLIEAAKKLDKIHSSIDEMELCIRGAI